MRTSSIPFKPLIVTLMAFGAMAASQAQTSNPSPVAAAEVQRDVNQQNRIEQGLKSGQLSTHEAARLEKEEAHVDRLEARSLRDGKLTPAEQQRLNRAQNQVSQDIHADKTNTVTGHPQSASSQRLQADVQRNAHQEARIEQGLQSGSLTQREAAHLERGQARVDGREARTGADGHVGPAEQRRIQRAENHQSHRIHREKHNG